MKIEITGNPGTGNTFSETHIGYVENYNPNATTVIVNKYGSEKRGRQTPEEKGQEELQKMDINEKIKAYVGKIKKHVANGWVSKYDRLWDSIIAHPKVSEVLYDAGKQMMFKTKEPATFNRNLVARCIHMMHEKGVFEKKTTKADLARSLDGSEESSIRQQLGYSPDDAEIEKAVSDIIDNCM